MAEPYPTISLVIPTIGRPTLARTLASVRRQTWFAGDEVLLLLDGPQPVAAELWEQFGLPGRCVELPRSSPPDWGHTPRNVALDRVLSRAAYLMALDDDDELTTGAVATVRAALTAIPGRPHLFRMDGPRHGLLWADREIRLGNVGTPMFIAPNDPSRLGRYTPRHGGDCDFIRDTVGRFPPESLVWREEVICLVRPSA